ncbi:MAG TPA: chromate resistance protein, partial [Roseiflexaceae bacterium]|nr:chromate resistance protein [Roseiflexaceae bacterium]
VLLERYDLAAEPALSMLGQIVNTADIRQSPYARPEGAGLKAITEGLRLVQPDDEALRVAGLVVFDALYAYCGEQLRLGRG